jgi:hypothetical protein
MNAATYLVRHPELGWLSFGGNVRVDADGHEVRVTPRDAFRQRIYLAPAGLYLTLDAGTFEAVELDPATGHVRAELSASGPFTPAALLRVEQPATLPGVGRYRPAAPLATERGAFVVPLVKGKLTSVELRPG